MRCPADAFALAAGVLRLDASRETVTMARRELWCVPGMADRARSLA